MTPERAREVLSLPNGPTDALALRRAYTAAVRLHRPEVDAVAFQEVREAYELLRSLLASNDPKASPVFRPAEPSRVRHDREPNRNATPYPPASAPAAIPMLSEWEQALRAPLDANGRLSTFALEAAGHLPSSWSDHLDDEVLRFAVRAHGQGDLVLSSRLVDRLLLLDVDRRARPRGLSATVAAGVDALFTALQSTGESTPDLSWILDGREPPTHPSPPPVARSRVSLSDVLVAALALTALVAGYLLTRS